MAAADTEEARAEVQAAQEALAVQAKEAAATLEAELHKDTANKSIGTDLTWSNFHSETQRQVSELSAAVLKRDTMLEQAQAEMQRMRSELSVRGGGGRAAAAAGVHVYTEPASRWFWRWWHPNSARTEAAQASDWTVC